MLGFTDKKVTRVICERGKGADTRSMDSRLADQSYNLDVSLELPFNRCENIYEYLEKQRAIYQNCETQYAARAQGAEKMASVDAPNVMSEQKSVSSPDIVTNLRERGVDEADMAKVSKDHIFVASPGQIAVLDRKSKQWIGSLKVGESKANESIVPLMRNSDVSPQILAKDEQLVVIAATRLQVYNLKPMKMPTLKEEVTLSQPAAELRLIGSRLVVLSKLYSSATTSRTPIANDQMIRSLPCHSTYPGLSKGGLSFGLTTTVVKSIDLNDLKNEKSFAFLQYFDSYITTHNIYLYSNDYSGDRTYIRKISINEKGDLLEVATGSVPGNIKDSWALSESGPQGEFLSVVSTSQAKKSSQLSILNENDSKLTLVGSVGGFGVDESVKAVRKIENIVYVVTFKQIDPLFAIDISDVTSPKILSALKIPGFSSYMHPFGASRLIGLGYSGDSRFMGASVQMSLFDTAVLTDIKRLDAVAIGGPGSNSIATVDYHAFFMDPENDIVGVPVDYGSMANELIVENAAVPASPFQQPDAANKIANAPNHPSSGAAIYKIGPRSINAFKFIHHEDIAIKTDIPISPATSFCPLSQRPTRILRLMKVDNQLVSISENGLKSFHLDDDLSLAASASWETEPSSCAFNGYD